MTCFKVVSKTKRLRVKDKQSDTFRSLFCLSGEITAYLFRIRSPANSYTTKGPPHQEDFVCDIWIFKRECRKIAVSAERCAIVVSDSFLYYNSIFQQLCHSRKLSDGKHLITLDVLFSRFQSFWIIQN